MVYNDAMSAITGDLLLLVGLGTFFYGLYWIIRYPITLRSIIFLAASIFTIVSVVYEHTILIDLSLAGGTPKAENIKNVIDIVMTMLWVTVVYLEYWFHKSN
jgi:hypothetical protein